MLGNLGSVITGIESAINLVIGAFQAVIAPVAEFGKEALLAAARVDTLEIVNRELGENAGIPYLAIQKEVDEVRRMGIEAAVASTVVSEFIKANLDLAKASDVARIAQDAAVIAGMNSTETTARIIDGIVTLNPLILRNAGIIVDTTLAYKEWAAEHDRKVTSLTTEEKQMIVLNAVIEYGARLNGIYEASMESVSKQLGSFPRYFNDILVALGEPFQQAFADVVFSLADFAKWIGTAVSEGGLLRPIIDEIAERIGFLASVFKISTDVVMGFLDILGDGDTSLGGIIYDLGIAINDLKIPVLYDLGTALFDLGLAVKMGAEFWPAFKEMLETMASGDSAFASFAGFLRDLLTDIVILQSQFYAFKSILETEGLVAAIGFVLGIIPFDEIVAWMDDIDSQIADAVNNYDWTASGDAFGETLAGLIAGAFMLELESAESEAGPAIGRAINDWLLAAMGVVSWQEAGDVMLGILDMLGNQLADWIELQLGALEASIAQAIRDWFHMDAIQDAFTQIGKDIVAGLAKGISFENIKNNITTLVSDIVNYVKALFGVSSPSTVFMEIGRNIVQGLWDGMKSMWNSFVDWVGARIGAILDTLTMEKIWEIITTDLTLKQALQDAYIGTSSTTTSTSTGTTGSHDTGTGSTGATGQYVTNNFYGTVYIGSYADLDNANYDCPSPNVFVNDTAGQIGGR